MALEYIIMREDDVLGVLNVAPQALSKYQLIQIRIALFEPYR